MHKKGSLELSVNAIVVFVLAFAMLSVGFFLVNMIRGQLQDVVPQVFKLENFQTPPDSQNPLVFTPNEIKVESGGETTIGIGYYNAGVITVTGAKFDVLKCLIGNTVVTNDGNLLTVNTIPQDVPQSEYKIYTVLIKHPGAASQLIGNNRYICEVGIMDSSGTTHYSEQQQIVIES